MKNRDIFSLALALLAERGDEVENGDYVERAGYLISAFCTEVLAVNRRVAETLGASYPSEVPVYLSLDDPFPLCECLSAAAGAYLAAMLVLEEDAELSDKLFMRYCDMIATLSAGLPMQSEPIVNKYGV
ncbi:MAG: hypothetical protein J6B77_02040 [Clostridia bacterium]|nr:hypothetical protein [Clostridia bacterium]